MKKIIGIIGSILFVLIVIPIYLLFWGSPFGIGSPSEITLSNLPQTITSSKKIDITVIAPGAGLFDYILNGEKVENLDLSNNIISLETKDVGKNKLVVVSKNKLFPKMKSQEKVYEWEIVPFTLREEVFPKKVTFDHDIHFQVTDCCNELSNFQYKINDDQKYSSNEQNIIAKDKLKDGYNQIQYIAESTTGFKVQSTYKWYIMQEPKINLVKIARDRVKETNEYRFKVTVPLGTSYKVKVNGEAQEGVHDINDVLKISNLPIGNNKIETLVTTKDNVEQPANQPTVYEFNVGPEIFVKNNTYFIKDNEKVSIKLSPKNIKHYRYTVSKISLKDKIQLDSYSWETAKNTDMQYNFSDFSKWQYKNVSDSNLLTPEKPIVFQAEKDIANTLYKVSVYASMDDTNKNYLEDPKLFGMIANNGNILKKDIYLLNIKQSMDVYVEQLFSYTHEAKDCYFPLNLKFKIGRQVNEICKLIAKINTEFDYDEAKIVFAKLKPKTVEFTFEYGAVSQTNYHSNSFTFNIFGFGDARYYASQNTWGPSYYDKYKKVFYSPDMSVGQDKTLNFIAYNGDYINHIKKIFVWSFY